MTLAIDPDCPAPRHGSYAAWKHAGCHCAATLAVALPMNRKHTADSYARRRTRLMLERRIVRLNVVESLLLGRRRETDYTRWEMQAAVDRLLAIKLPPRDIARQIGMSVREVQRHQVRYLRELAEDEE